MMIFKYNITESKIEQQYNRGLTSFDAALGICRVAMPFYAPATDRAEGGRR